MQDNSQVSEFGIILLFIIGGFVFLMVTMLLSKFLRPEKPNFEKLQPYECGEEPEGDAWGQMNIRFYVVALIFILFEVELIFLFPWATVFGDAEIIRDTNGKWGWFAIGEMFLFIGILVLGLAYVWVNGYLDWIKPKQEVSTYKSPVPKGLYDKLNERNYKVKSS